MSSNGVQLRVFGADTHCPCCRTPYGGRGIYSRRTKGHIRPNTVYTRQWTRWWVWQCYDCNQRQRKWTIWEWLRILESKNDWRAGYVRVLVRRIDNLTGGENGKSGADSGAAASGQDDLGSGPPPA